MSKLVKRRVGRPQKFTLVEIKRIYDDFSEFIESRDDPTVVGFSSTYSLDGKFVDRDYLQSRNEFSALVKQAIQKQEAFLLQQYKNPAMAIFRLKQPQHGYTDKREVEQKNLNLDVKVDGELASNFLKYLKGSTSQS